MENPRLLPPSQFTLATDDLHVWRASLDVPKSTVKRLREVLSTDERARADRFYFEIDRDRFVVARGCLRTILGLYLAADPSEILFSYDSYGKPRLAKPKAPDAQLNFNLTHSYGLVLCAVTRGCEVGVDLEKICEGVAAEEIAERFFSATEVAQLRSLPASKQTQAFFNCWTRKEAFIKAKGTGLSLALDQFAVTLAPNEPTTLLETQWDHRETSRWLLKSIDVGSDFAAAVAFEGQDRRISYWQLDERMKPSQSTSFVG